MKKKNANEISQEDQVIDCDICNPNYYTRNKKGKVVDAVSWTQDNLNEFYSKDMTLLEFFEHEVNHEYEKAKRELFNKTMMPVALQKEEGINDLDEAPFHPVFLASLLNQKVFRRESSI